FVFLTFLTLPCIIARLGNGAAHIGIGLDVLHPVIIHHPKVTAAERFSHCKRHLCLGFDHLSPSFLCFSPHFLFGCHSHCPTLFRTSVSYFQVGLRLICLQLRADVFTN